MEWNGSEGSFSQDALGVDAARKVPLVFLHADPGPKGYAKYTAWFLARDGAAFSLLWCYLNDSGTEFYCWLYRYPVNQLVSIRFTGNYHFSAPAEPVPPLSDSDLKLADTPHYAGPDFAYGKWTRRSGTVAKLDLHPARSTTFAAPLSDPTGANSAAGKFDSAVVKTLTDLRAYPLHEINVPDGNGWLVSGWRELHALAFDPANNPYYLILYSHTTRGFVIDLRQAQTYETDYGQKVVFSQSPTTFGDTEEQVTGPPDLQVVRYSRHELTFTATGANGNPYNEIYLDVQFHAPNGKVITVPGFWDGGNTWHARIAPTVVGRWTWTTTSSDPGMHRQEGAFTCISLPTESKGFLGISTVSAYRHHFATSEGTPFFPVFVAYPVHHIPAVGSADKTASAVNGKTPARNISDHGQDQREITRSDLNRIRAAGQSGGIANPTAALAQQLARADLVTKPRIITQEMMIAKTVPATAAPADAFSRYQRDVDALADLGFNRFVGEYMIDPVQFAAKTQSNEGGAPFIGYDPDRLNPAYFQAMDRRIDYANAKGIVPDIGIGELSSDLYSLVDDAQIKRLWRYLLGRYGSFNICWTPFGRPIGQPVPTGADVLIEAIQKSTLRYDPVHHPLTMVMPGGVEVAPKRVRSADTGAGTEHVGDDSDVNKPAAAAEFIRIPAADSSGTATTAGAVGQTPAQVPFAPPPGDAAQQAPPGNAGGRRRGSRGARQQNGSGALPIDSNRGALPGLNDAAQAPDSNGTGRGRGAGAERSRNQPAPTGFIQSPSGLPLGPVSTLANAPATPQIVVDPIPSWMDVIVFNGGPTAEIPAVYSQNKPVVIYDRSTPSEPAATRTRLWMTLMNGGYWAGEFGNGPAVIDRPETRWEAYSGRLFEKTRFWRLAPHNEMLGGNQESAFERRRRHQAEVDAAHAAANQDAAKGIETAPDGSSGSDVKPTAGPIYVLADPGWEYVVYFQRGGMLTLDLLEATGKISYVWFNPRTGEFSGSDTVMGGAFRTFRAPDNNDWTLYISRR
jgi:hypothetical protein